MLREYDLREHGHAGPRLRTDLFARRSPRPPWDDTAPVRDELFGVERLEQHARQPRRRAAASPTRPAAVAAAARAGLPTTPPCCWPRIARAPRNSSAAAPSCPRPNGCSTTTTSSKSRSARSATTCRPATTASCRSSPTARSPATRACSASPGRSSRTPTATSIPRRCAASSRAYQRGAAAHDRRAVGGRDHAAHRAGREPAAPRRPDHRGPQRAQRTPTRSPTGCSRPGHARTALRSGHRHARHAGPLSEPFAAQLVKRLRDQDPRTTPALRLAGGAAGSAGHHRPTRSVAHAHQRQGASNVTVRNVITSMRLISDIDWAELFESVSLVDARLRAGSGFAAMDFADAQPVPQRDRGAGPRLAAARELEIAARALRGVRGGRATARPTRDSRRGAIRATT